MYPKKFDMSNYLVKWLHIDQHKRPVLLWLALTVFALLSGYPLLRSLTTAIFFESAGAKNSPHVWMMTVFVLMASIGLMNRYHHHLKVKGLFHVIGFITIASLVFSYFFYPRFLVLSYVLYIVKEVYIVLLLHLAIGLLNAVVTVDEAKKYYGFFGALGSIAGIIGGEWTHSFAQSLGSFWIMSLGLLSVVGSMIFFHLASSYNPDTSLQPKSAPQKPLQSLEGVERYVLFIVMIIILSQFIINIANFKFNLLFEVVVSGVEEKTSLLGRLYSAINVISLGVQMLILPWFLTRARLSFVHASIPSVYLLCSALGFMLLGHTLLAVAAGFVVLKAIDYSLFSAAKEILYFPLTTDQKYGAKYLGDMVFYRFAKGLISFVLIFIQDHTSLNAMLLICLVLWLCLLIPLFKTRDKLLRRVP